MFGDDYGRFLLLFLLFLIKFAKFAETLHLGRPASEEVWMRGHNLCFPWEVGRSVLNCYWMRGHNLCFTRKGGRSYFLGHRYTVYFFYFLRSNFNP